MCNQEKNLKSFKEQVDNILKSINNFDDAEKHEALDYIRNFININHTEENTITDKTNSQKNQLISTNTKKFVKSYPRKRIKHVIKPLRKHNKNSNKISYKCQMCAEITTTKINLLKHMEFHIGTPISCSKCRRTFNNRESYEWHQLHCIKRKTRTITKRFKCTECPKEFTIQKHLNVHLKSHARYYDTVLTRREQLAQHMSNKHNLKLEKAKFKCDHCDKWFTRRRSLFYHLQQHSVTKLICLDCGTISKSSQEYNDHRKKHEDQKPWECSKCKDKFTRKYQYFSHLKRHEHYKCLTCNESYALKMQLYRHKQLGHLVQGLEPCLRCPHCPATFYRNLLFQVHIRKHKETETAIHCKFCNKTFHTAYQYYKHCKTILHDKNSPEKNQLVCENCGKQFTKKYVLKQHLRRFHSNIKNTYSCKYCEYKTQFKPNLVRHTNLHFTSNKQFICHYCGKSFSTFATLADHINYLHLEVKQFPCEKCDKSFKRKAELVRHQSCHSDARPHCCKICAQTYKRLSHLRRHEETAHSIVKSKRVQLLKTDSTGAVVPVPTKQKANKAKNNAPKNNQDSQSISACVPTVTSFLLPETAISENLISLDATNFNQQSIWTNKLNMKMDNKNVPVVLNINDSDLIQTPLNSQENDIQILTIVNQIVNSLLPSKEIQDTDCPSFSQFTPASISENRSVALSEICKNNVNGNSYENF